MNKIQLVGRLTKDPELIFTTGNGTAVTKITLAVNRPQFDKSKPREADFIPCVCLGKRAEAIANYVRKGHLFGVSGRLQINKYVDKDGNNRWSTDIFIEDFEFLQGKGNSDSHTPDNQDTSSKIQTSATDFNQDLTPIDDGDIPF